MLVKRREVDNIERTALQLKGEVIILIIEHRTARHHIQCRSGSEIFCRLKRGTLLTVIYRKYFHIVHRELTQIDCSVLSVSYLHAIVEHSYVLTAHTADIDCLKASYTSVVFYLNARKISKGIGHRIRRKALQLLTRQRLSGNYLADGTRRYDNLFQSIGPSGMRHRLRQCSHSALQEKQEK